MTIENIRNSFKIYSYSASEECAQQINKIFFTSAINYKKFDSLESLKAEYEAQPPHVLLYYYTPGCVAELSTLKSASPETHVIVLSSMNHFPEAISLSHQILYDCIRYPIAFEAELLKSIDRALENDFHLYKSEQLSSEIEELKNSQVTKNDFVRWQKDLTAWSEEVNLVSTVEEALEMYMKAIVSSLGGCKSIFFKFIENHKTLLATQSVNVNLMKTQGLGVDLKDLGGDVGEAIKNPRNLLKLREMIKKVFNVTKFIPKPIIIDEKIIGMIVVFEHQGIQDLDPNLKIKKRIFENVCSRIQISKRLHLVNTQDESTLLLNKQTFLIKITEEISRSRRLRLPVSFILTSIDQIESFEAERGREESEFLIKSIATIFMKNSRTNDLIGRLSSHEIGLLLPHTSKDGATIKAERLRQIVETADFSKTLYKAPRVTISAGVSEYPTLCGDGEELFETSDEALYQLKKVGPNKICVVSQQEGFVPDFHVPTE